MDGSEPFLRLAAALAIGVLIGLERGWQSRELPEGARGAGIRTFGLIGLLGGITASLAETLGPMAMVAIFSAFAVIMLIGRLRAAEITHDMGLTTTIAALLTFALAAMAVIGDAALAAAGAVVTALLLGVKPTLHAWLEHLSRDELFAVLQLLVMSVVLLPVLPDRGFGPWAALNPFELWLMVVLVAGISFVGYVTVRIAGKRVGLLLAGLAGGLVSSTAVALGFSRLARRDPDDRRVLAAAIVVAASTMFPRTLLLAGAIDGRLLLPLAWPLGLAGLVGFACAAALAMGAPMTADERAGEVRLRNPFELGMALKFGLLLAGVVLLARAVLAWMGDAGLYAVAAISGLTDVDAVTLSFSRMAAEQVAVSVVVLGIVIATASNTLVKAGLATAIGGGKLGLLVGLPLIACLMAGGFGLAL